MASAGLRRLRGVAVVISACFVLVAAQACAAGTSFVDDRGVRITLAHAPLRIAALSPHLVELTFAAGAGERVAAVVRYSDYPLAASRLPRVGDASRLDLERIVALKPDLLLAWKSGNPPQDIARLERLGFPVFVTEPGRLSDIPRLIRSFGALARTLDDAEHAAAAFESELSSLRARYSARAPVAVFYEIWHRPLLTINGAHLISDVITLCGGRNVFADAATLTPAVSLEAVVAARPQIILGGSSAIRPSELSLEWRSARVAALRSLPVGYVPPDVIQRQTPRIIEGARAICAHLEGVRSAARNRNGRTVNGER